MKRKATTRDGESPAAQNAERGLPKATTDSPRLTARLRGEEMDALVAFAKAHRWTPTTALRAILRERFLGEKLPF